MRPDQGAEVPPAVRRDPDQTHEHPAEHPDDRTTTGRQRWVAAGRTVAAHVGDRGP